MGMTIQEINEVFAVEGDEIVWRTIHPVEGLPLVLRSAAKRHNAKRAGRPVTWSTARASGPHVKIAGGYKVTRFRVANALGRKDLSASKRPRPADWKARDDGLTHGEAMKLDQLIADRAEHEAFKALLEKRAAKRIAKR